MWIQLEKNEWEWNDLAEGPCSRTEKTIYKKSERSQPYYQPLEGVIWFSKKSKIDHPSK